jgi:hypothetical protein
MVPLCRRFSRALNSRLLQTPSLPALLCLHRQEQAHFNLVNHATFLSLSTKLATHPLPPECHQSIAILLQRF